MKTTQVTHTVSPLKLVRRVNKKLAPQRRLRTCRRGTRWWSELGDFHLVNVPYNVIIERHVDLEELARKLGVLKDWETVADHD